MSSLADVFRVLHRLRENGMITDYAIGGATAVLFYAEPTRTYDLEVFVTLPSAGSESEPLSAIYGWAEEQGFAIQSEHLIINDVPVQFLPAYNDLVDDAVKAARVHDYDGVSVRVVDPEHLVVLALQAGGARRRERAWQLLQSGTVDRERLRSILVKHGLTVEIPDDA